MSAPSSTTTDGGGGTARAQDAAHAVQQSGQAAAGSAADHAKDLAGSASDKATQVVSEASDKARDLLDGTREQMRTEAENRRGQAVSALRALGDEMDSMQEHDGDRGVATHLAGRGSGYVRQTADWLDGREPTQILDDVKGFARRRPGTFLLGALVAGVVAGRLTRGLKSGAPAAANGPGTRSETAGAGSGARPFASSDGPVGYGSAGGTSVTDPGFAPVNDRIATDETTALPPHRDPAL